MCDKVREFLLLEYDGQQKNDGFVLTFQREDINFLTKQKASREGLIYSFARETYSPVRVSTLMISPSCKNKGTRTTAPDSSLAALLPPLDVSPLKPVSVSIIFKVTKIGGVTRIGRPFHNISLHSTCSFNHIFASPTSASCRAYCS